MGGRFSNLSNWNLQPAAESQAALRSQAGQAAGDQYNALLDQAAAQAAAPAPSGFLPAPSMPSLSPQWSPAPEAQYSMPPMPARPAPQGWLDSASRSFQSGLAGTGSMFAGAAGLLGDTDAQAGIQKWTGDTIREIAPEQYARPDASMSEKLLDPDWWKTTAFQAFGSGAGSVGVSAIATLPLLAVTAFAPQIAGAVGISVGVARVIGILATTLGRAGIDSVMESASAYQEARVAGKSESEASTIASTVGANNMLLNVGLEAIPGFGQLASVGTAITRGAIRGGVVKTLEHEWGNEAVAAARQRLASELTQQGWMTGARTLVTGAAKGAAEEYLQERQQGEIQKAATDGRPWDLARALTSHELDDDGLAGALISLAGGGIAGAGRQVFRAGRALTSPSPQLGIQGGGAIGRPQAPVPEQPRTLDQVLAAAESNHEAIRALWPQTNPDPGVMANLAARSATLYAELVALAPPGTVEKVQNYLIGFGESDGSELVRDLEQGSPIPDKVLFGKIVQSILLTGPQFADNKQNEWVYVDPAARSAGTAASTSTGNGGSGIVPPPPTAPPAGEAEDKFQTDPILRRLVGQLASQVDGPLFEDGRLMAGSIRNVVENVNQQIGQARRPENRITPEELAAYVNRDVPKPASTTDIVSGIRENRAQFGPDPQETGPGAVAVESLPLSGPGFDDQPLVPGTAEYDAYVEAATVRRLGRAMSRSSQPDRLLAEAPVEVPVNADDFIDDATYQLAIGKGLVASDFDGVLKRVWKEDVNGQRQPAFSREEVEAVIAAMPTPAPTPVAPARAYVSVADVAADREYRKVLGDVLFDPDVRNEVKNRKPGPAMSEDLSSHLANLKLQYPTKTEGALLADLMQEANRIDTPVAPTPVVASGVTGSVTGTALAPPRTSPERVVAPPMTARVQADTAEFPFDKSNDRSYHALVYEAGLQGDIKTGDGFRNFERSLEEILDNKARPLFERSNAVTHLHGMFEALVKEELQYYPDRAEAAARVRQRLSAISAPDEVAEMEDYMMDVAPEDGARRRTIPFVLVGVSGASEDSLFRDRRNLEALARDVRGANDDGSIADGSAADALKGVRYLHSVRVSNNDTGRKTISGVVTVDTALAKGQSDGEILEQLKVAAQIKLQLQPRSEDTPIVIGRSVTRDPVAGDQVELLADHVGLPIGTTGMVDSVGNGTYGEATATVRIDGISGKTKSAFIPIRKLGVYEIHDDDEVAVSGSSATEPTVDRYTRTGRRRWTIANALQKVREWTSGDTKRPLSARRLMRQLWGQNAKDYLTEQEVRSELVRNVGETDAQFEARVQEEMRQERSMPSARQDALTGLAAEMASLANDPRRNAYLGTDDVAVQASRTSELTDRFGDIDIDEDQETGHARYNIYLPTLRELLDAATGYGDKWSDARANGTPAPEGRRERSADEESIQPFTVSEKDREFFQAELARISEMRSGERNSEARSGSESTGVDELNAWIASLRESDRTKPIRSELTKQEIAQQNPGLDDAGVEALMQEYQLVPFLSYRAGSIDQIILSLARTQPKETVEAILSTISDAADNFRNSRSGNEKITDTFAYYLGGLLGGRKGFKGGVRAREDAQKILDIFTANRGDGFQRAVMRFAGEQALSPTQNFYLFRTRFSIALADAGFWKWRPDGTLYDRIAPDGTFKKDQRVFDPSTNSRGRVLEDQGMLVRLTIAGGMRRHVQNVVVRWSSGELHGQTTNIHPLDITLLDEAGQPQRSLFTLDNPMPMDKRMGTKISVPDAERLWGRIAGWDTRLFGDDATASTKLATIFQDLVQRNIPDKDVDAIDDSGGDIMAPRRLSVEEESEARKKAAIFLAQMVSIHGSQAGASSTTIATQNMTAILGVLNGIDGTGATAQAFNEERMRWARQTPRTMNDIVRLGLRSRPDTIAEMVSMDDDLDDEATVVADAGDEYDGKKVPRGMQVIERPMTASDRSVPAAARRLVTAAWRNRPGQGEMHDARARMREIEVQVANDTLSDADRLKLNAELTKLKTQEPTSPVNLNIGMGDDQDRHITNKSTAVRDPLTRSRMAAIADVLGRSSLLGEPMRQADVRREGAMASRQARALQVTSDMVQEATSRDSFFMQYYRDNLTGGQNDGVTSVENMARLFATWSDDNADLASGRQFIDGDLIARYLHAVSPEPQGQSKLKPVAGITRRVLSLMTQSNSALLQEANRESDQARKDALLAVHASAKAEVIRFQEAHARLLSAPETAEEKAATVQEALPVLVANQMAANRVVGPLDRAMVQEAQEPDAVESDTVIPDAEAETVELDPKETAATIEAYVRANPGRTKGQIARGTRLTVLQVEDFITAPGTSAVASGKSGGHATYSIGTAEETTDAETTVAPGTGAATGAATVTPATVTPATATATVTPATVTPATVTPATGTPVEPVIAEEEPAEDPLWERASLYMKTVARTVREVKNIIGGLEDEARALINAHMDEIQVITGARPGIQERYRMLDPGEVKVEPAPRVARGRRATATAPVEEAVEEGVEEGTAEDPDTEVPGGQNPEVKIEDGSGEEDYDGPFVDIVGEYGLPDDFRASRTGSRQPRATTPQWSSIQDISAGIAASMDKRIVVIAVSNADEARRHLQHGVNPATFGSAFAKGMQPEGATAEDVILAINKSAGSVADKQKVFVVIARVEDDGHIGPENVIGVTPLSTFSPSVVSLFGAEEPTTPEVTGPTREEVRQQVEAENLALLNMQSPDELGDPGETARDAFEAHVDLVTDERMQPSAPVRRTARGAVAATPEVTGGAVGVRQFAPPEVPGLRPGSIGGIAGEKPSKGGALMNVEEPEPEPVPDPAQVREGIRKQVVDETLAEMGIASPDELGATGEKDRDAFELHVNLVTDGRIRPARVRPMGPEARLLDLKQRLAARGTVGDARQKVLDEYGLTEAAVAEDPALADKVAALVAIQLGNKAGDLAERDRRDQEQRDSDALATADAESARVARTRLFPGQQVDRRIVGRALGIANANSAELDRAFQSLIDQGMLVPSKLVETRDGEISRPTGYVMAEDSLDGLFEDDKVLVSVVPGAIGSDESFGRFGQMTLVGVVSNGTQALLRTREGKQLRVVLSRLQLQIDVPGAGATSEDGAAVKWNNKTGQGTWSDREWAKYINEASRQENPALTPSLSRNDRAVNPLRMRLLGGQPVDETIMANALGLDKDWRTEQLFQQMVNQGLFIRQPLQVQGGTTINLPSLPQYLVAFDAQDRSGPVLVRYTGNGLNLVMAYKGIDKNGNGEFDSTGGGKPQRYVFELNGKNIVLVDRSGKELDPDAMDPWRPPPSEPPDGPVGPPKPPGDQEPEAAEPYMTAQEKLSFYEERASNNGDGWTLKRFLEEETLPYIINEISIPRGDFFDLLEPGTEEYGTKRRSWSETFLAHIQAMHTERMMSENEARVWLDKARLEGATIPKDASIDWPPPPNPPGNRPPTSGGDASGNDIVLPEVAVTRKRWFDGIIRAFGTSNNLRFTNMLSNPMSTVNEFITQTGNVLSLKAQAGMAAGLEERAGLSPSERKMTKEMSRGTTTLSDGTVIGWGSGIMDGMQMAMQVMRTGDMPEALIVDEKTGGRNRFVNQELLRDAWGREFGETGRKIGNVIGMPMRIRMANDILFATVGESIGIHMMANREAVRDGMKPGTPEYGDRVVKFADAIRDELYLGRKEAPDRSDRLVPGSDTDRIKRVTEEASNIARNLVWQGEMKSLSFGLEQSRWASPVMNFIIPFMQVGARIARAGADMTPGLGQALMAWDISRGDYGDPKAITSLKSLLAAEMGLREDGSTDKSVRPASMRLAAQGMGLMVSGVGASLAMAGLLTGAGPDDDRERAAWLADGKRPYSLKIGGTYVNAALVLGPLAWPLIAGALIFDGATGKNKAVSPTSETWQNLAGATNEWIFNQTALSNLSRVIDSTQNKGSGKDFERWIASSVVAPFIPYSSALRAISSASDDVKRNPQTFIDFMKMYFPGASQDVKAKTDDLFKQQGRTAAERYLPFVSSVEQASDRPYAVIGAKSQQEATRIRQAQGLVADYFRNPLTAPKPTEADFTMVLRYGRDPSRYYETQRKVGKLVAERTAVA